jgi:hypothetical protein
MPFPHDYMDVAGGVPSGGVPVGGIPVRCGVPIRRFGAIAE